METSTTCANCGKGEEESNNLKSCAACKLVKYCSRDCQVAHRPQHKKECKKRAAELYDEKLFADLPPRECPICFLPMPLDADKSLFKSCCGKSICLGCIYAMKMSEGKDLCAFCRMPPPSSAEESIKRLKNLMDKGNGEAIYNLGGHYDEGTLGLPQDYQKANELYLTGGELGCADAYYNLGISYDNGNGVEVDKKKAKYYYELAAMCGHIKARHNLGCSEGAAGNEQRAYRHMIIAARGGSKESLDMVKEGFKQGFVTKDEYANTLRACHERQREMKSKERDTVALIRM